MKYINSDNIWFGIKTALIIITAKNFLENRIKPVNGFTPTTFVTHAGGLQQLRQRQQQCTGTQSPNTYHHHHQPYVSISIPRSSFSTLHGLLDDMMLDDGGNDSSGDDASSSADSTNNAAAFDDLFSDIIFSANPKESVESRIDECTNEGFLDFLSTSITNSSDDEEIQAYQDLLSMINEVNVELKRKEKEAIEEQKRIDEEAVQQAKQAEIDAQTLKKETSKISAADMLKRANEIDQAVMVSEASDDEQPDNFMRDAKLERGLSGFNNRGQMRVGGR